MGGFLHVYARIAWMRYGPHNRDHSLDVTGQYLQAHFGADPFKRPSQEVSGTHPGLQRPKRMLGGLPS